MNAPVQPAGNPVRNVLFIMCDQLRADHLSCYGGAGALRTPHIDRLASMGVQYDRAYVTSAVCGPSRASYYTGRYPLSHRVTWNRVPHPVDEWCLGEYLAQAGLPLHLLGKTHFVPDRDGLRAKGYAPEDEQRFLQGGFVPIERYDGHFELSKDSPYRRYLRERGITAAQGYVFAPPLPSTSFLQLLDAMDPVTGAAEAPAPTKPDIQPKVALPRPATTATSARPAKASPARAAAG